MQQTVDDSHSRLERALVTFIQTVNDSAAKPLFGTCSAAVATLRQTVQSVTVFNPTAADLNCLATRWTAVTGLTLAGEFDGDILVSGGEEGWWSSLQRLTLHHSAPPNPMGRLLLDVPAGVLRLGPFSLNRLSEEADQEAAAGSSRDRQIADTRAMQDLKVDHAMTEGHYIDLPEDREVQISSTWHEQLPAAVATYLAEPLWHLPAAAPNLRSLTDLDLSTYVMQPDSMQQLAAASPCWPQLHSLKLHWRWVYATDALQHLAAAAPHWPLLQQFCTADKPERCRKQVGWLQLLDAGRHWPQLQQLVLPYCAPGPGMAEAAAAWPQLRVCVLRYRAGDWYYYYPGWHEDAVQQLLQALQHWPLLEHLELPQDGDSHSAWLQPSVPGAVPQLRQVLLHVDSPTLPAAAAAIEQHWHHLTRLDLVFVNTEGDRHVAPANLQHLAAAAPHLQHLESLSVTFQALSVVTPTNNLSGLSAAAPSWPLLTSFKLETSSRNFRYVASCIQEVAAAAPAWHNMTNFELRLSHCACDIGVAVSAAAHHWRKLTSMQLIYGESGIRRDQRACASMLDTLTANASSWPLLQQLTLHSKHGIEPEGCQKLAVAAPAWPQLRELSITFGPDPLQMCYEHFYGGQDAWSSSTGPGLSALAAAAVHWPCLSAFGLRHMDLYSSWGLRSLADTAAACWPQLTRLELDNCGDLSQQIKHLKPLTSLRELWLPGCTLSIESDLPALRTMPSLVALVLDGGSGWLLGGVDMWSEGVGGKLRGYCCQGCEWREEQYESDGYEGDQYEDDQ